MHTIETFGTILKKEIISNTHSNILSQTLVLENLGAYPGYYARFSKMVKPVHLYLITSEKYSNEQIMRSTTSAQNRFRFSFNAVPADIELHNHLYPAIRIKGLSNIETLGELQNVYIKHGIKFEKHKKVKEAEGLIKIHKVFYLEENEKGLYYDMEEKAIAYFRIPGQISWPDFEKLTDKVKNNWTLKHFDAATAFFYRYWNIEDVIRVYSENIEKDYMIALRDKYLYEISMSE